MLSILIDNPYLNDSILTICKH